MLQQSKFALNQTLVSFRARDVEHFTIHGEYFLVVANEDGFIYTQDSVVYRWEAGKFKEFQRISTHAAQNTHYFTINTRKFLTFSNNKYDRNKVSVYEWKKETFSSKIQDIQIKYLSRCNIFSIHNITYIARGKAVISDTVSVLKWSGKQFESFQDLPSSAVRCRPHLIHANGSIYLAIANFKESGNNGKLDIDSFIYRWNGSKLVHHQSIPTHGTTSLDSFTTHSGEVFLVVANSYTEKGAGFNVKSAVYKMADNKFSLYQQLPS